MVTDEIHTARSKTSRHMAWCITEVKKYYQRATIVQSFLLTFLMKRAHDFHSEICGSAVKLWS